MRQLLLTGVILSAAMAGALGAGRAPTASERLRREIAARPGFGAEIEALVRRADVSVLDAASAPCVVVTDEAVGDVGSCTFQVAARGAWAAVEASLDQRKAVSYRLLALSAD